MLNLMGKSVYLLVQNTCFCSAVEEIHFALLFDYFFTSVKKRGGGHH